MPGRLRSPVYFDTESSGGMSEDSIYRLTHPEVMTNDELKDILRNSCIDFSNFEKLERCELIEMYKRVAMPLPQRGSEDTQNSDVENKNSENGSDTNLISMSNNIQNLKRRSNDSTKSSDSTQLSSTNESEAAHKKIRLARAKSSVEFNGVVKRTNDGKQDGSPLKKRQKITWP